MSRRESCRASGGDASRSIDPAACRTVAIPRRTRLIPDDELVDTMRWTSRLEKDRVQLAGPGRAGGSMATTQKSRASYVAAPDSASAPGGTSRRARGIAEHPARSRPRPRRSRSLRRQVIALQRISSLGVLAGGVFHELNNALTPILNYAKLGLRNPDPAYRERALTQIVEAAQRAATITRGMLGLSAAGRQPRPPRADRPGPAGPGGDRAGREGHGASTASGWT